MNMRIAAYSPEFVVSLVPEKTALGRRAKSQSDQTLTPESGELMPNKTSASASRPTLLAQNVPTNVGTSNALLTPESLFGSASQAKESQDALAALLGNEAYAKELQARLGKVKLLGTLGLNLDALLRGDFSQALTGTFGPDFPVKNNATALKAEAEQRLAFGLAGYNAAQQKVRFLVNGLLLDAATRKTSIADLREIVTTQEKIVATLEAWQKQPGSKVDDQQVLTARRDLQRTQSSLVKQEVALTRTLDQIEKLTKKEKLSVEQVPTLKNAQQTVPAAIPTSSQYLTTQPDLVIQQALENNPEIKVVSEAIKLAKARYEVVKGSAVTVSARAPNVFSLIFGLFTNPIATLFGVAANAFRGEVRDVTTQLAEAKGIIEQKEKELEAYKKEVGNELKSQLDTVNSADIQKQVETQKKAVNIAYEKYQSLERWAAIPGSNVGLDDILLAKVAYLEQRQAYNESAQQFLGEMNRVVSLAGGYGDAKSELFGAFNGNFTRYWGESDAPKP